MSYVNLPPQGANGRIGDVGDDVRVQPVDVVAADGASSRGLLYRPVDARPRVGVHVMHPRTDQTQNYNILPLVAAGYAVLGRGGRSVNNDVDTVHEEILLDVAAGVRLLREQGCEQVVLLGNSGGGPLAAFYQSQALAPERLGAIPGITDTSLADHDLPQAEGIVLIGAHSGPGLVLAPIVDPSVVDERDPWSVDAALDMYDPANGFRLPVGESHYSDGFLAAFRRGQADRISRLDAIARDLIDRATTAGREAAIARPQRSDAEQLRLERHARQVHYMAIYRTVANPAWIDKALMSGPRPAGGLDGHPRPDLQNYAQVGLAHYLTPRAWLSTWSAESSRARTAECLAKITSPTLIVHYDGDELTTVADVERWRSASVADDVSLTFVENADHYGRAFTPNGHGPRVTTGTDAVVAWMRERFPVE